jgi:predicted Rdx family selenoprotein
MSNQERTERGDDDHEEVRQRVRELMDEERDLFDALDE